MSVTGATNTGVIPQLDLPPNNVTSQMDQNSEEYQRVLKMVGEAYGSLALSIGSSMTDAGWTGWDWRQNDQN